MNPEDKDRWIKIREHAMFLINRGYVKGITLDRLTEILEAKQRQKEKQAKQDEQQRRMV